MSNDLQSPKENNKPQRSSELVGSANETVVLINDRECSCLLDTGSMVSTISESLCNEMKLEVEPLATLMNIEGAGGHQLRYLGFVRVDASFPVPIDASIEALLLVVPDTAYTSRVPVLVGTNILNLVFDTGSLEAGSSNDVPLAWKLASRCLVKHKGLSDNIGLVKSTKCITIPPSCRTVIHGLSRTPVTSMRASVVTEEGSKSKLPGGLVIVPCYMKMNLDSSTHRVPLRVMNLSSKPVTIPGNSTIGELHMADSVPEDADSPCDSSADSSSSSPSEVDQVLDQFDFSEMESQFSKEKVDAVKGLISKWHNIFSKDDMDLGRTDVVKHKIELSDDVPFKDRYRRIPPAMVDEVRNHIREMLDLNVIRPSHSPYSSNVVLVRKRDGSLRFCIDLRRLNAKTIRDSYALPRINDTLDVLHGAQWFSSLDLKSGYWQVELEESDKHKTAFTAGQLGFFECNRMAFGLTNAPATFQRLMETCLGDIHLIHCLIYLDDIIIFSRTFEEHLERLESVFQRLSSAGLKVKPSKCQFFKTRIKYLGHIVSREGVSTDPEKVDAVRNWPVPKSVDEVRRFLGFTGFYRRFVKDFAKIAKPLHDLLKGSDGPTKRKKRKSVFRWQEQEQMAFDRLIDACCSTPILAYADYGKPFVLHTDACSSGLGAVLYQNQDGKQRVIGYASRSLNKSEKNYPAHKLEFLALKWAVSEKFHDYLYGTSFTVKTDNNPLTYVLSTAKLDATGHRWVAALANYNFNIEYISGKKNVEADALSRLPHEREPVVISNPVICAILQSTDCDSGFIEAISMNHNSVPDFDQLGIPLQSHNYDWSDVQSRDPVLKPVIDHVSGKVKLSKTSGDVDPDVKSLLREVDSLCLKDGVLYRQRTTPDGVVTQLVLPQDFRRQALQGVHTNAGHFGRERTLELLRERFFWPGMSKSVCQFISQCERCICRKTLATHRAPLTNIVTTYPLELLCIDFLTVENSKGGVDNLLVVTDHFTRYAQVYPTKNQTAITTAKALVDNFIPNYGFPTRLHSDQGRNFESATIRHLCKLTGIEKSHTSPWHPSGNGSCERFNRTLLDMLGTLDCKQKENWKTYLPSLVHAYNSSRHDTTGYSPFFLMYGRQPKLPVDILLGVEKREEEGSYSEFVSKLKDRFDFAYKLASSNISKNQEKQKRSYDMRCRGAKLTVNDRVLVKNVGLKGRQKIADRWQSEVFVVVGQPHGDIPVFEVRKEGCAKGTTKVLHRNLLLPIGSISLECDITPERKSKSSKKEEKSRAKVDSESVIDSSDSESSDSEEEEVRVLRPVPAPRKSLAKKVTNVPDVVEEQPVPITPSVAQSPDVASVSSGGDPGEAVAEIESEVGSSESEAEVEQLDAPVPDNTDVVEIVAETDLPRRSSRARKKPERFDPSVYTMMQDTRPRRLNRKVSVLKYMVSQLLDEM